MGKRLAQNQTIVVYIISNNTLAGKYLVHIIKEDHRIKPILCKTLPQPDAKPSNIIFILDGSSGLFPFSELLRRLHQRYSGSRVVVVNDARTTAELVRLLELGVQGFVNHNDVSEGLCQAIHTVAQGRLWMPDQIIESHFKSIASRSLRRSDDPTATTPREYQVLELVKQRLSNKEIAQMLGVQECTVKYHISNIFGKLQIASRSDLIHDTESSRLVAELFS